MMTDSEIIAVVEARIEGKKIQCRNFGNALNSGWHDVPEPNWNFLYSEFRVAPEPPKPREWVINVLPDGRVNTGMICPCRLAQDDNCKLVHVREIEWT